MKFKIRIIEPQEVEDYKSFRLEGLKESPYSFSESFEDEIHKDLKDFNSELNVVGSPPESFVLGAFDTNKSLLGIIRFVRDSRLKGRHKSFIYSMYVKEIFRKKGIGSALLDKTVDMARKNNGIEQIHLWVLHSTETALDFYLKNGFKSQGTKVFHDLKYKNNYIDAEYMVKYINE